MDVRLATHSGHPERGNEDFVGCVPGSVVLLDGAGIPGTESICHHGVGWYTHRLGGVLLGRLSRRDGRPLPAVLADAIEEVADAHRSTCDLSDPSSPQATVAIVRLTETHLEYLLLADSTLLLGRPGSDPEVLTDGREVAVRRACTAPLAGLTPGSAAYEAALPGVKAALRARRNTPGGYWIAKDDPAVAAEAVTGSTPLRGLDDAILVSNGVTRLVDPYGAMTWTDLVDLTRNSGPDEVLRFLRSHEPDEADRDDATVARVALP